MTAAVHTAIKFEPPWEPPDELSEEVDAKFEGKVNRHYEGLKSINVKAEYPNEDKQIITEPLCSIRIKGGGKGKTPGIDSDALAQLIWARGIEHALKIKKLVCYRLTFYGANEEGPWQHQASFKLDSSTKEDEDAVDPQVLLPQRGEGVQILPTGINGRRPPTLNNETIAALNIVSQQSAGLFAELRASMQQQRMDFSAIMHRVQQDYSSIVGDVRGLFGEVRIDLKNSRDEASKANARINKMADQSTQHFHNQQEANKQGWQAFHTGMQMQLQAMQQSMSWERQYMFTQFDQLAAEKNTEEKTSIAKEWGPLIVGAVGQILASKGSPAGELLQQYALKAMGAMDGDDENDEDNEDEDTPTTPPKSEKTVMGVPPGVNPEEHFNKNPLVGMVQLLNSMLSKEQRKKLQELLPPLGWSALDAALKAKKDMMAKAFLITFISQVKVVKGLDDQLKTELTEKQFELFNDIAEKITKGSAGAHTMRPKPPSVIDVQPSPPKTSTASKGPPPPPPPAAKVESPTIPPLDPSWGKTKIRSYAKKHYDINLPERMGKPKMLKAIDEAAKTKKVS